MKKILLLLIICMIFSLITCTSISYAIDSSYDYIRIGLFYSSTAKKSVTLKSSGGFEIRCDNDGISNQILSTDSNEINIVVNEGGMMESEGIFKDETGDMEFVPKKGYVLINGTPYRGSVILSLKNASMTVINKIKLDEYLYSVIGKEMDPEWPMEALKAQTVCARNFAIKNWNKFSSYGFNLDNSSGSQTYGGINTESNNTIRAVEETGGMLLYYGNDVAQTFYYASNGGASSNVKYVWGSEYPYLVSVSDDFEDSSKISGYYWKETFTPEQIMEKLSSNGVNIGNITNVEVTNIDNGTVYGVKIYGDNGEYTLKNEKVRSFFGLKSQRFIISYNGAQHSQNENIYVIGSLGMTSIPRNLVYTMAQDVPEEIYILGASGIVLPSGSSQESDIRSYTISGSGWGHGIGMSQWGARGMAERGYDYKDILLHYFPGCTVQ